MQYSISDFKIENSITDSEIEKYDTSDSEPKSSARKLCGTQGVVFYKKRAIKFVHRCNRVDCPECRDRRLGRWVTWVRRIFDYKFYRIDINFSQFSSFRHKYNKTPYVKFRFPTHYTIITGIQIPNSVPIDEGEFIDLVYSRYSHTRNYITANRAFYKKVACHFLHNNKEDYNMQKVARGEFLGRAAQAFSSYNLGELVRVWGDSGNGRKAFILSDLHKKRILKLSKKGEEFVRKYLEKYSSYEFYLVKKHAGLELEFGAIPIFETDSLLGYIKIPELMRI